MPFYLILAIKNVFRDRRRSITLGVNYFLVAFLLFIVFSVTGGMKKNITESVVAASAGHVTISGEYIVAGKTYQGITEYPAILEALRETDAAAKAHVRYALTSTVYYKNVSKRLSFTGIQSTDNLLQRQAAPVEGSWDDFYRQDNGVLIPETVARYFGLALNDEILLATRTRLGAFNTATIQVKGIYATGNYFLREQMICHFDFLRALDLAPDGAASRILIFFDNAASAAPRRDLLTRALEKKDFVCSTPKSSADALNAVSAASPRYKVLDESVNQKRLTLATAQEVTGVLSQAVAAVNALGLFVAAIMLFIITIALFINMRMTINDRMTEIGTLRAMGAEQTGITRLFIAENVLLCLSFAAAGTVAALFAMTLFSALVPLPPAGVLGLFLNNGRFVFQPSAGAALFIVGALCAVTAVFSYFPARYGARIPPVAALAKTH